MCANPVEREVRNKDLEYRLFTVTNSRGENLSCLIFIRDIQSCPTVMYLHGNGGSKLELLPILRADPHSNTNFCSFDFSGCGRSEGSFITYGEHEVSDILDVVGYIRKNFGVRELHLWGRR